MTPAGCRVDYLRLSVTDRCNFRCVYCMPPEGVEFKSHEEILSYEEMAFFVDTAVELGISKVRLTGGEPLVRKGIVGLVALLHSIDGVNDISLTTNGALLPDMAADLRTAGLSRVNISLDTLDPDRYRVLTRGGRLESALAGVEAALAHHLEPVKINAVMLPELLEEVDPFIELTRERPLHVRFIEWMPIGGCGPSNQEEALSRSDLMAALQKRGELLPAQSPGGSGPARYFRLPGHEGTLGFISSVSDHFCDDCNRLRLTADGRLRSCLFSSEETDVRDALRERDAARLFRLIQETLAGKTYDKHRAIPGSKRGMSQIGG